MSTLLIAFGSFFGFIIAYHTYGKYLAKKLFRLSDDEPMPSVELRDNIDYIPTNRFVLFGHHFTTIAGTGPIVGPAIAVMWGWLPALLWVVFGCIFIGAVHDFTALVLSARHKGQTLGDVANRVISPTARLLFLIVLLFMLAIITSVFANVIATLFTMFPRSVIPVWISLPVAIVLGLAVYRYNFSLILLSFVSLFILLCSILLSAYVFPPVIMPDMTAAWGPLANPIMLWSVLLLIYCFAASVLPVWLLLQPRDYVNSQLLYLTLFLIAAGLCVAALTGQADVAQTAPALRLEEAKAAGAPSIFPFLFITIACGAVSGFHALVSSGTTSKQLKSMHDAQFVGYGGMLLEGILAVLVILCCTAGIGMGVMSKLASEEPSSMPTMLHGSEAWLSRYGGHWSDMKLGEQVAVFVDGGANFVNTIGMPIELAAVLMTVLVACFAATTIDSSTRLMRYVIQELAGSIKTKPLQVLTNRYTATLLAVVLAGFLATLRSAPDRPYGTGGLILWPLFGSGNQIIAGLTLIVGSVYLWRQKISPLLLLIPAVIMIVIPIWGMSVSLTEFYAKSNYLLLTLGLGIIIIAVWLVVEAIRRVYKPRD